MYPAGISCQNHLRKRVGRKPKGEGERVKAKAERELPS
jgi:hypothetical protein